VTEAPDTKAHRNVFRVAFPEALWRQLYRTGDAHQTIWLALSAYPETAAWVEENPLHYFCFDMPHSLAEKVRRIARRRKASLAAVVRAAVRHYFEHVAGEE
jgi:hypothetical protein